MCTEIHVEAATPEKTRCESTSDSTTQIKPCSRYILDKPQTTEESFSKNFEEAMNILQEILPVPGIFMTFQREREDTKEQDKKILSKPLKRKTRGRISDIHLIKKREMLSVRIL